MATGSGSQSPHQGPGGLLGGLLGGPATPAQQGGYPGCLTMVIAGVILFFVAFVIVGTMWLVGVDLRQRFLLVFFIFAVAGAFMFQLAKRLEPYVQKWGGGENT